MSGLWLRMRSGIGMAGALVLATLVIAPLRTMLFLDETEPLRRRCRRRR